MAQTYPQLDLEVPFAVPSWFVPEVRNSTGEVFQQVDDPGCKSSLLLPPGVQRHHYQQPPTEPPPGLTAVVTPSPTLPLPSLVSHPCVVLTDRHVSLFSDIAPFLDEGGLDSQTNPLKIDLDCGICSDYKLEMPQHVSMFKPGGEQYMFGVEDFAVSPCGHFFGYHCLSSWVDERTSNGRTPNCPICRFKLVYRHCHHLIPLQRYNVHLSRECQLPMTVPEGGEVPPLCRDCEQDDFDNYVENVVELAYPSISGHPFRDPQNGGPKNTKQLRQELRTALWQQYYASRRYWVRW